MFHNRSRPLLFGSVKSNMGHSEICAGLCALIKTIITIQSGVIPANLHFEPFDDTLPGSNNGMKLFYQMKQNHKLYDFVSLYLKKK